ncbi:MAG: hypothetical protein QME90_15410 [Thermodesulfobacteriota bacterium]|nr:hypothetical protein [Thermodesulfobacteriota bacterium]
MDKHFLEFWGNFLINVAKGQKQLEDISKWMMQGFKGFEDLTAMFQTFYSLDKLDKSSPDYLKMWKKAEEDFKKSFKDYLSLLGLVPKEEYLGLVEKYEALKQKVASQEETISHLRMLLGEKVFDPGGVVKGFQDLMQRQKDQFQKLMESIGESFQKKSS